MHESYSFWIDTYKKEGIKNKLDNIEIQSIEIASVDIDTYYETFTVRIFASCLDYMENRSGKLIGGSNKKARKFSEYWTFMRRAGIDTKENNAINLHNCPNCGAPADKMGQAGECEYCGTKISNGDFSWVLAMITQDESYNG